ncbi:MAG: endolytic transglycosylase MltG [Actinomycetota bacterium]|nr:endolytic transglycosylase MltG [Actinomycetota bacterium]
MKRLTIAVLIAVTIVGAAIAAASSWIDERGRADGAPVSVVIDKGTSGLRIAAVLQDKKVIRSALAFRIYLKLNHVAGGLKAGGYELRQDMAFKDILAKLNKGPAVRFVRLIVPEGLTIDQTADQVAKLTHVTKADFVAAATPATASPASLGQPPPSLEGFLFPSTYFVTDKDDARSIVKKMVDEFDKRARALGIDKPESGRDPYSIVKIASMIEREAKVDAERPTVAGVIENRLTRNIPLGLDATIQYLVKKFHGEPLTQSDLAIDSPFNTRKVAGLPPTPIASPGIPSLKAALHPEKNDYIYYVLTSDCKTHFFTSKYAEFEHARQQQPKSC